MKPVLALLALLLLPAAVEAAEPRAFERGSWVQLVAAHRGRPTIVHFWGVTCGPCLVELPQWGGFAARGADVDVVMIEADPVAGPAADLNAVLAKAGLDRVESWRFSDAFSERLQYEIDPNWHGELPYTVLIGRDGSAKPLLGPVDFAALSRWLDGQPRRSPRE